MKRRFSLKGLQALEATIRTGSFVAAADELDVTPAAVSQLVRSLEERVNRQMFYRVNRKLVSSEASQLLATRLTALFTELEAISSELAGEDPLSHLVISVPPSVTGWLAARMDAFVADWGVLDFTLRGDEDPVDLERHQIDIRWSFGEQNYPRENVESLFQDHAFAVCAPAVAARYGPFEQPSDLLKAPLIHTDWGPSSAKFPSWNRWFDSLEPTAVHRVSKGMVANSSRISVDLAIQGLGVALCQGFYLPQLIASKELLIAHPHSLALSQAYCLTVPTRSSNRPVVAQFKQWLMAECGKCQLVPAKPRAGESRSRGNMR